MRRQKQSIQVTSPSIYQFFLILLLHPLFITSPQMSYKCNSSNDTGKVSQHNTRCCRHGHTRRVRDHAPQNRESILSSAFVIPQDQITHTLPIPHKREDLMKLSKLFLRSKHGYVIPEKWIVLKTEHGIQKKDMGNYYHMYYYILDGKHNLITIGVDGYEYDAGFPVVYYFKGHQFFNRVAKELKSLAISLS